MPVPQISAILLMFAAARRHMLASMSETSWNNPDLDAVMSELPTGTVTLLLADVEGSTRLWETQPDTMKAAVERLDQTLANAVATHPSDMFASRNVTPRMAVSGSGKTDHVSFCHHTCARLPSGCSPT
jgi:hypothetical protein